MQEAEDPALLPLAAAMMRLTDSANDRRLVHDWLAVTARSIDELALGRLVPTTFKEMLEDNNGPAMREIAGRHQVWGAQIREKVTLVHDLYPLKEKWIEGVEKLSTGIHFPPLSELFPYKSLKPD